MPSVRLLPYLQLHHSATFLDNICLVKLDTEGHDVIILQDLVHTTFRPPVIWTEWYALYRFSGKDEDGDWMEEVTIKCFTEIHDICVFSMTIIVPRGRKNCLRLSLHLVSRRPSVPEFGSGIPDRIQGRCV